MKVYQVERIFSHERELEHVGIFSDLSKVTIYLKSIGVKLKRETICDDWELADNEEYIYFVTEHEVDKLTSKVLDSFIFGGGET